MDDTTSLHHDQRLMVLGTIAGVVALTAYWLGRDRRLDSFPGPKLNPIVGVGFKLPAESSALFRQWAAEYGDAFKIRVGWYNWVVLNSPEAVREVLEKQAAATSSKAPAPLGGGIVTAGKQMPNMPYGPLWRAQRAVARSVLTAPMIATFEPCQVFEAKQLLHDLATANANQRDFYDHIRRYNFSIAMTNTFGVRIKSWDHPDARNAGRSQAILRDTFKPGAYLVDDLPPLALLPAWLQPGRRRAEAAAAELRAHRMDMWGRVARQVEAGTAPHCFARSIYERRQHWHAQGLTDEDLAWVAAGLIEAGFETTSATLNSLMLQLAAHPACQAEAHAELDRVVGAGRLPGCADLPALPYVRACVKEMLRLNPVLAPGLRHYADADVTLGGRVIPRGTVLVANTAFLHRDPARFEAPDEFRPDRYRDYALHSADYLALGDPARRDHFAFSTGRRACPGARLAENNLVLGLAFILWAFAVRGPVDTEPVDTGPAAYPDAAFLIPRPFAARFLPRAPDRLRVLEAAWEAAQREGYELRGMPVDLDGVQQI